MSRILTELVGATTRVDTSINVVLNEGDRLGITVAMTDITKRGSSSALRIEKVNADGLAGSKGVKAGYQLRAVNDDREVVVTHNTLELFAKYMHSLPRPLVVAFERTDLDPREVSVLQLQLLFLVYIHTGLSLSTLYTETINIHLPIWRRFKPCSRQHPCNRRRA
jgi:hypothetical protein